MSSHGDNRAQFLSWAELQEMRKVPLLRAIIDDRVERAAEILEAITSMSGRKASVSKPEPK